MWQRWRARRLWGPPTPGWTVAAGLPSDLSAELSSLMRSQQLQHTKLGRAFSADEMERSSFFCRLAAFYLECDLGNVAAEFWRLREAEVREGRWRVWSCRRKQQQQQQGGPMDAAVPLVAAAAHPAGEAGRAALSDKRPAQKQAETGSSSLMQQQLSDQPTPTASRGTPSILGSQGAAAAELRSGAASAGDGPSSAAATVLAGAAAGATKAAAAGSAGISEGQQAAALPDVPAAAGAPWTQLDDLQLEALASDAELRQLVFGSPERDWQAIGQQLGRGADACRKRWRQIDSGSLPKGHQPGSIELPAAQPKRWQAEELDELVQLAEDEQYRVQEFGRSGRGWAAIGRHFGVSSTAAHERHKLLIYLRYRAHAGNVTTERAPRMPGLFGNMVETVLRSMPGQTGTYRQILSTIEQDDKLLRRLRPLHFQPRQGHKTAKMLRWHCRVYNILTTHRGIQKSSAQQGRDVLWRLLPEEEWLELKKQPSKKRPADTATPHLGKNARSRN